MTNSDFRNTDTEELKKKGNFASDYDIDCKRHYRFEAGQNNSSGTISYRVLTNHGSSHGFYKKWKLENISTPWFISVEIPEIKPSKIAKIGKEVCPLEKLFNLKLFLLNS